jgi:hypothetical protein
MKDDAETINTFKNTWTLAYLAVQVSLVTARRTGAVGTGLAPVRVPTSRLHHGVSMSLPPVRLMREVHNIGHDTVLGREGNIHILSRSLLLW